MNARAAVRSKMAQNEEWKTQFLPKVTPMLQLMENQLLTPFPASPVPKFPQTTGLRHTDCVFTRNLLNILFLGA